MNLRGRSNCETCCILFTQKLSAPVHSNLVVNTLKRNLKALSLVLPSHYLKSPTVRQVHSIRDYTMSYTQVTQKNKSVVMNVKKEDQKQGKLKTNALFGISNLRKTSHF